MAGIGKPLHDRAQALRHAGSGVADAVIVDQEETQRLSVQVAKWHVNTPQPPPQGVRHVSGCKSDATGTNAAAAGRAAETHQGSGSCGGAPAACLGGGHARRGADVSVRLWRRCAASPSTIRTTMVFKTRERVASRASRYPSASSATARIPWTPKQVRMAGTEVDNLRQDLTIAALIPTGTQASPGERRRRHCTTATVCPNGSGFSVATNVVPGFRRRLRVLHAVGGAARYRHAGILEESPGGVARRQHHGRGRHLLESPGDQLARARSARTRRPPCSAHSCQRC